MIQAGLVESARALAHVEDVEPQLFRYPAVDPRSFRRRVQEVFGPPAARSE